MNLRTIRARIALLTGGLLLLILAGFSIFLYISLRTQLYQVLDGSLRNSAKQLLLTIENERGQLSFEQGNIEASSFNDDQGDVIRLVSPTAALLDDRSDRRIPIDFETLHSGLYTIHYQDSREESGFPEESGVQSYDPINAGVFRLLSIPIEVDNQVIAYLQVGRDLEPLQETLMRLRALLFISGPVLVIVAALAGYWLAGRALAPVESIRREAASIGAHDLSRRLELNLPNDEVGRLARTFNEMLARLDASFRRQRRFTADASHELRTPLSVIRGEVDVTLEQPRTPDQYTEVLRTVGMEAERMTRLVNELLLLARSDAAELQLEKELVNLADLLSVLVEQMAGEASVANVTLNTDLPLSLPVWGDQERLLQLFINLLKNTFIHAPDSQVTVHGYLEEDSVVVSVTDTGPGILPEHLPHLFERFYRVDKARSGTGGGSGLGLAIAQEIAHAHEGIIQVQSQWGQGSTFTVRLPRYSE